MTEVIIGRIIDKVKEHLKPKSGVDASVAVTPESPTSVPDPNEVDRLERELGVYPKTETQKGTPRIPRTLS